MILLFVLSISSRPSFPHGLSVYPAKDAQPICPPNVFQRSHYDLGNPSPGILQLVGNTIGGRSDESTGEVPYLISKLGTAQRTDARPFWQFSNSPFLAQKAVSLISGKITIQLPFADFLVQDCEYEQQLKLAQEVLGNPQLTGAPVQQNDTPAQTVEDNGDEKTGAETKQSADVQAQSRFFVGTVIDNIGANLRSGPGLEYAILDKWSKGQQFPFEMVSEDGTWLRINEGLWITASAVAGLEISLAPSPAQVNSPQHPVPIIKASGLSQRAAAQSGDLIFLGSVSVRPGANIRSGPGLEYGKVSAVSYGSLIAWVAMSEDREWLYLQNGHWIFADLASESNVYRIIKTVETTAPFDEFPVTEFSQEHIGQVLGPGYRATVTSESGAGIRSGPGLEYELVATAPLGQEFVYLAQSENGEWLLLEDGDWIYAFHVSTQGFDRTLAAEAKAGALAEDLESPPLELEKKEALDTSFDVLALRPQALAYINRIRLAQDLSPVRLGDNQAAQNRSTELIQQRYLSSWNMAGLTATMQYTLEGGEGYSEGGASYTGHFENSECIAREPADMLLETLDILLDPPWGHKSVLQPEHTTVNIGISYDCRALALALDFEGEYVTYQNPPTIQKGKLFMEGRLLNGATLLWLGLVEGIRIDYLPLPRPLTRGQLFRTGGECLGTPVATIMVQKPLLSSYENLEEGLEWSQYSCLSPYEIDFHSAPPHSEEEARQLLGAAADFESVLEEHHGPAILPDIWKVENGSFTIQAEVTQVVADHGPGVYVINLLGEVDGERVTVSRYAIFVE